MELLISLMVFGAITTAVAAAIQFRTDARLATSLRLDRVAGRMAAEWNLGGAMALRRSRLSSIAWVERVLGQLDLARSIDLSLVRADWGVRVAEYMGMVGVSVGIAFLLVMLVTKSLLFALVGAVIGLVIPHFILKRAVSTRKKKLEKQLVEALVMISNALKAGFGLMQALDQASRQLEDPVAKELKQTIRDTQIGSSVEDAINNLGIRCGSYDLEIVVTAIIVQRNVGGNLSEILDNVAHTMRERERIRGEISTLTAQQRLTGFIIAGLPPVLGLGFTAMNASYMSLLVTESLGKMMIGGAIVLEIIGAFMIKRIVAIEV